jgi:hypothetical protein
MVWDGGVAFRLRPGAEAVDRLHRWATLIALASPLAGLVILAAAALTSV